MRDTDSYYDIFFIYHPADIDSVRRVAAQIRATGINCHFDEDEFGKTADGLAQLKAGVLRSYTVAFALSSDSAESQLCNELLQYAVTNSKRLVTLILDEDIEVEVHPAIAQNPFVFFREQDDLVSRVEELRGYLTADHNLKLHTELLVFADNWQRQGRTPELLLPPDRMEEARKWLAMGSARDPNPSPLQVEYIHNSRRQRPKTRRPVSRHIPLGIALVVALIAGLILLQQAVAGFQAAQISSAATSEAQTQLALTAAEATAASDSAVGLIDDVAATSASLRTAIAQTATADSITATAVARITQTAQAAADMRATSERATQVFEIARDEGAERLIHAGEEALLLGNVELALAMAWEAKDTLDDPKPAYRLMRRATAAGPTMALHDVSMLQFHPEGVEFALVTQSNNSVQIYDSATWSLQHEFTDHEAEISTIAYSHDGVYLISAARDGEIIIRDSGTREIQHRLQRLQGTITAAVFYPAGDRLVSAGDDPLLVLWDINSGEELATVAAEDDEDFQIYDLVVTADGEQIIGWSNTGGETAMAQWSADTLEPLSAETGGRVYRGHDGQGRIGYTGGRSLPEYPGDTNTGDLVFWDLTTGLQVSRLSEGFNWTVLSGGSLTTATDNLLFVTFLEDLALVGVTNSESGQRAVLVNVEDGSLLRNFDSEIAGQLMAAEFLDSETIVSATQDNRLVLWSSDDGSLIREIATLPQAIQQLQLNVSANTLMAQANDGKAYLLRMSDAANEPIQILQDALPGTSISPSGDVLLVDEEDGLSLRGVDSQETIVRLAHSRVSNVGATFATYGDGRLSVYNTETGAEISSWDWDGKAVQDLHLSPGGGLLLVVAESNELWLARRDAASPQRLASTMKRPSLARFSPKGDLVLTLHDEFAVLWESESGVARGAYPLGAESSQTVQAAFSESGESIIFFVQLEDGLAGLTAVELDDNAVRRETFVDIQQGALSSDGMYLALALTDGSIKIIETSSGEVKHRLPASASYVQKLQYLPNADVLVSASGSDLILWDAPSAMEDHRFSHPNAVSDFSLSENGQRILTLDENGAYRLWQVESPAQLLERIEAVYAPRELTCAEREQYLIPPLCG